MKHLPLLLALFVAPSCHFRDHGIIPEANEFCIGSRVDSHWEAWLAKEWDTVINMIDPEVRDEFKPQILFQAENSKAEYLEYKRINMEVNGSHALVEYQLTIKYLHPLLADLPPRKVTFFDTWINKKGEWFRFIEKPDLNKFLESIKIFKGGG